MSENNFHILDEKLRQEKKTFDLNYSQSQQWFKLRLIIGYMSVILLPSIFILSVFVLLNASLFPTSVVMSAGGALFVDSIGLLASIFKIVLKTEFKGNITPITQDSNRSIEKGSDLKELISTTTKSEDSNLLIQSATYGTDAKNVDVKEYVCHAVANGRVKMHVIPDNLGGDPLPNIGKALVVTYSYEGKNKTKTVFDRELLILP